MPRLLRAPGLHQNAFAADPIAIVAEALSAFIPRARRFLKQPRRQLVLVSWIKSKPVAI